MDHDKTDEHIDEAVKHLGNAKNMKDGPKVKSRALVKAREEVDLAIEAHGKSSGDSVRSFSNPIADVDYYQRPGMHQVWWEHMMLWSEFMSGRN